MDSTLSENYYEVLGIEKNANDKQIKRSYRKLAGKWHPDRFQNTKEKKEAEAKFKRVGEAYSVLSDPKKKETYDRFGKEALKSGHPGGFSFGNANDIFRMFFEQEGGSPFENLFSGLNSQRRNRMPGGFTFNLRSDGNNVADMGDFTKFGSHCNIQNAKYQRRNVQSPIIPGTEVVLHNLSSKQYLFKIGRIKSFTGERFIIDISSANISKDEIAIKPSSVSQIVHDVQTHSLNSKALNQQTVTCQGYQEGYGRIRCLFGDNTNRCVRPKNLLFPIGTLVRLDNLSDSRVNNHWGKIISWLPSIERYEVKLEKYDKIYKLKPINVFV